MKNKLIIDLCKLDNSIKVEALFKFTETSKTCFSFCIADTLLIKDITSNGEPLDYNFTIEKLQFRVPIKKINVTLCNYSDVKFCYSGITESYHTLYEDNALALNFYSAWYPTELSEEFDCIVKIHLDESYYIVNGNFNSEEKLWYYYPLDFDVNVLALKDFEQMRTQNLDLIYFGKENSKYILPYYENYNKIINFYETLFGNNKVKKNTIVLLPKGNKYDGYRRESLIVFGGIREDYEGIVHLLAHELAHSWCTGAKADTWEDWLNETFAEWAALLYQLEQDNNIKFNQIIEEKKKKRPLLTPLKMADLSRPEGVHDNGVLHFYELYSKEGIAPIKELLTSFDALEEKSTENLLCILENRNKLDLVKFLKRIIY